MTKLLLIAILLLVSLVSLVPASGADLWVRALNSQSYECNSQIVEARWVNEGNPIKVKRIVTWIGADKGAIVEISACTYRLSNWMGLSCVGWDHYAQPTGLHQWAEDLSPDWVTIGTGDALVLQTWCKSFSGLKHAHVSVMFYYTE